MHNPRIRRWWCEQVWISFSISTTFDTILLFFFFWSFGKLFILRFVEKLLNIFLPLLLDAFGFCSLKIQVFFFCFHFGWSLLVDRFKWTINCVVRNANQSDLYVLSRGGFIFGWFSFHQCFYWCFFAKKTK